MSRDQNLDAVAPVLAMFTVKQTDGTDDLKDANIGEPVMLTGSGEVAPIGPGGQLLGKLIGLTLRDCDDRDRLATVQVGGMCRLAISIRYSTYPKIGQRVVGGKSPGTVAGAYHDDYLNRTPRGTVLEVNGTTDCVILLN